MEIITNWSCWLTSSWKVSSLNATCWIRLKRDLTWSLVELFVDSCLCWRAFWYKLALCPLGLDCLVTFAGLWLVHFELSMSTCRTLTWRVSDLINLTFSMQGILPWADIGFMHVQQNWSPHLQFMCGQPPFFSINLWHEGQRRPSISITAYVEGLEGMLGRSMTSSVSW